METITVKKLVGRRVVQGSSGAFTNTTIVDTKGRTISAAGTWAEGWVEGGSYDIGEIVKGFSKDGKREFLNAKKPASENKKTIGGYSAPTVQSQNTTLLAYQLAIQFASIQYTGKKAPKLSVLDYVAEHFKSKIEGISSLQKQEDVPTVELNKEETQDVSQQPQNNIEQPINTEAEDEEDDEETPF
jgi:hypothetical protein